MYTNTEDNESDICTKNLPDALHNKHAKAIKECNMFIRRNWEDLVEKIRKATTITTDEENSSTNREDVELNVSVLLSPFMTGTKDWNEVGLE